MIDGSQADLHVVIVAGEPSGDAMGASLITALKKLNPKITVSGIAGPQMIAAGCEAIYPTESLSVMGIVEVLGQLPAILKARKGIINYCLEHKPAAYIGIDAPDFNLPVEKKLRANGITTVHYNSPTVWAWREKRIYGIAKSVNLMLTILPFETAIYEKHHIPVKFIGHPMADEISMADQTSAARAALDINTDKKIIALLPGSRVGEVKRIGPRFIETAKHIQQCYPQCEFIAPMANSNRLEQFYTLLKTMAPDLPIKCYQGNARQVMAACDVVLVASGTATLEAMLLGKPMVMAYIVSPISYQIGKRLIKVDKFALPNLLANEQLVPEYIQDDASVENLSQAVLAFLQDEHKVQSLQHEYKRIHELLSCDASRVAAKEIIKTVSRA